MATFEKISIEEARAFKATRKPKIHYVICVEEFAIRDPLIISNLKKKLEELQNSH